MAEFKTPQVSVEDVERVIDATGSVFPYDLSGYAAAGVTVYLLEQWAHASPSPTRAQKLAL